MPKPTAEQLHDRARQAAIETAPIAGVGDFIGFVDEAEDVITMKFASRQKGYIGWQWHVTMFVSDDDVSVSEVNLLPGETSLLAPDWVPWADRLADWKALQAELEAQAAAEAAEAAEGEDEESEEDDSDDIDDVEDSIDEEDSSEDSNDEDESEVPAAEESASDESAVALEEQSDESENDSDDAGQRPPRFLRRRLGRLNKKKK
jgi:Protein of unknown function (DUF3027)